MATALHPHDLSALWLRAVLTQRAVEVVFEESVRQRLTRHAHATKVIKALVIRTV